MTIRSFHIEHAEPIRRDSNRKTGKGLRAEYKIAKREQAIVRQQGNIDQGFSVVWAKTVDGENVVKTRTPAPIEKFMPA